MNQADFEEWLETKTFISATELVNRMRACGFTDFKLPTPDYERLARDDGFGAMMFNAAGFIVRRDDLPSLSLTATSSYYDDVTESHTVELCRLTGSMRVAGEQLIADMLSREARSGAYPVVELHNNNPIEDDWKDICDRAELEYPTGEVIWRIVCSDVGAALRALGEHVVEFESVHFWADTSGVPLRSNGVLRHLYELANPQT